MKRPLRFRLRTLLVVVAGVAVFIVSWPPTYNYLKWRPIAHELEAWLASLELSLQEPDGDQYIYPYSREPLLFSFRNWCTDNATDTQIELPLSGDFNITGPDSLLSEDATRVATKSQALEHWRKEYSERYGWRWW